MFDVLPTVLVHLPFRSLCLIGGDFHAEIGIQEVALWALMLTVVTAKLAINCREVSFLSPNKLVKILG